MLLLDLLPWPLLLQPLPSDDGCIEGIGQPEPSPSSLPSPASHRLLLLTMNLPSITVGHWGEAKVELWCRVLILMKLVMVAMAVVVTVPGILEVA